MRQRSRPAGLGADVGLSATHEVSGLGAAMCAAVGSGAYAGLEEASRGMSRRARPVAADPLRALEYEEYYRRWLEVGRGLDGLGDSL